MIFLIKHLKNKNFIKIINNASWLFFDKIFRMGVGVFISVWLARYLGPLDFGILNYSIAFVAIFSVIANLGLNEIVVRDLINETYEKRKEVLGTVFILQLIASLLSFVSIVLIAYFTEINGSKSYLVLIVVGFSLIFQPISIIKYFYESQLNSKYFVWVENGVFAIISIIKIALIFLKANLISFAILISIEAILVFIILIVLYFKQKITEKKWKYNHDRAKQLMTDSWPLVMSGIAIMIYMRIDQVMIGKMLGQKFVGIYTIALKLSEIWYMIPMIITSSLFPVILKSKLIDKKLYQQRIQYLLDIMTTISYMISIFTLFFSHWLIINLFGAEYSESAKILNVHIWTSVFVFIGVAGGKWYITENLQRLVFYRSIIGAFINIVLNFYLIPRYSALGAAYATLISQLFSSYLFDYFSHKTKEIFIMKTKAMFAGPLNLINLLRINFNSAKN
ncbi:MAG: flippase [Chitinophagaceae bacterium]|nr:flippase [Chitinophagaceae bacterium]